MPDLSMMGIRGIKAAEDRLSQIAERNYTQVATAEKQFQLEDAELDRQLAQQAAAQMQAVARGEKAPPDLFGSQGLPTDFDDRSAPFDVLADVYARGGMPSKAMEFAKAASQLDKQDQEIQSAQFTDTKNQLENYQKTAAIVASTLGNARNDSEWEYAKAEIANQPAIISTLGQDNWEAISKMDFDPDVAALFKDRAMTEYQKATLDATANYRNRVLNNSEAMRRVAERNAAVNEQRAADARRTLELKGQGSKEGKSAEAPNNQQIKAVESLILTQVYKGEKVKNLDAVSAGAVTIASRANQLLKANKALSWDTAVQRAIIESQANNEWDVDEEMFSPHGLKFSTAVDLPTDPAMLRDDHYYRMRDGNVYRFMKGKFIKVRVKSPK